MKENLDAKTSATRNNKSLRIRLVPTIPYGKQRLKMAIVAKVATTWQLLHVRAR